MQNITFPTPPPAFTYVPWPGQPCLGHFSLSLRQIRKYTPVRKGKSKQTRALLSRDLFKKISKGNAMSTQVKDKSCHINEQQVIFCTFFCFFSSSHLILHSVALPLFPILFFLVGVAKQFANNWSCRRWEPSKTREKVELSNMIFKSDNYPI